MKFGRRAFLQFTAGAVGGTLLSPLPWKMADDSAIWSQNWSWRPSPERGEITEVSTTCMLCEGGCGIRAHRVNGHRAIFIEGNPSHPINSGGVCPLGASGLQLLYAPHRISQPMKQTKGRGEPSGFQPISWDDATEELAKVLANDRSTGKAYSLACITGQNRSTMVELWRKFFVAFGSQNLFQVPDHTDSLKITSKIALGHEAPLGFRLEEASYVLSFGANLLEGWGSPCRMQAVYRRWHEDRTGTRLVRLVQVEPRCSMTAAKADKWLPVKPGTEAALALGIAHIMIRERAYDAGFVDSYVFGFEDWTDSSGKSRQGFKNFVLENYKPDKVAELTGLDAARVQELAREFASLMNAVVVWGSGHGDIPNNVYHDMAFFALNVLKGNIRPDGPVTLAPDAPLSPLTDAQIDNIAQQALQQPRLDLALSKKVPLAGNSLYAFLDGIANGGPYSIDVLMIHEANPAYTLPENSLFEAALERVRHVVSFSSYMDETALHSDLILPNHMALERCDDMSGLPGAPYAYYAVSKPILPPQLDTRHTGDFILQLSKKLGGTVAASLPWESYESLLQERVMGLASSGRGAVAENGEVQMWNLRSGRPLRPNYKDAKDLWDKLAAGQCWYDAPAEVTQNIATESGRCELAGQLLFKQGVATSEDRVYLPHFAPLTPSGSEKEYPLMLVAYSIPSLAPGYLPNTPFMNKTVWEFVLKGNDAFVEIHPETAKTLGMKEGDKVFLKTPKGEVGVRIHLFPGARPGVVFLAQGLGHEAYDEYIQGKGVNPNSLIEVQMDPVTGLGTVWATRAQLHRA